MFDFLNTDPVLVLFGLFYSVVGLSLLIAPGPWRKLVEIFQGSDIALVLSGMAALFAGLLIVLFFQSWETPGHSLLSIIGYIALVEAGFFLFLPDLMQKFIASRFYQSLFKISGVLSIVIGVLFLIL